MAQALFWTLLQIILINVWKNCFCIMKRNFTHISRNLSASSILLMVLLMAWTGCQKPLEQNELQEAQPVLTAHRGCNKGDMHHFPIEVDMNPPFQIPSSPLGVEGDMMVSTDTPPYQNSDCLCVGMEYELEFTSLEGIEITVTDIDGKPVEFLVELSPEGGPDILRIFNLSQLPDGQLTVIIDFSPVVPNFIGGGGLCITDNFDGVIDPVILWESIVTLDTVIGNDSTFKRWLPVSMSYPSN